MTIEEKNNFEKEVSTVTTYPFDVLNGKVVTNEFIKLACRRFIDWCELEDRYFDVDNVIRVIKFIEKFKHWQGSFAGQYFKLEEWQKFIICGIYGWKWKKNKLRITRTFILSVGRKAGKSSLLSILGLYHLIGDGENGGEIIVGANSASQAGILFKMASNYLKDIDPKGKYFNYQRDKIIFNATNSVIKVVSSDTSRLDGLNCSLGLIDELAAAPNSDLWDIIESSQGSRKQPLMCALTTRGFQLSGFYHELEASAIEVLRGFKKDDSLFTIIYSLDENDDYKDRKNWTKANPNFGTSVTEEFFEQQIIKCENNPIQERNILTKIFNKWVSSSDTWIQHDLIYKLMKKVDLKKYEGMSAYLSFDLAAVSDLTAMTVLINYDDKFIFKTFYYLPESALKESVNSAKYIEWAKGKYITITPGNVTDYDFCLNDLMKISKDLLITKISYDDWNARDFVIKCTEHGLPLKPFGQNIGSMNRPTKELQRLILSEKVIIDKNPVTNFCFENAVPKLDWNDNVKIIKDARENKIDGVISMIMALGGYLEDEHYDNEISCLTY